MADYESKFFTKEQLESGYASLYTEEQAKVCPLYQGEPEEMGLKARE